MPRNKAFIVNRIGDFGFLARHVSDWSSQFQDSRFRQDRRRCVATMPVEVTSRVR